MAFALWEPTAGSYHGSCPYPDGNDLSQTDACKKGADLVGGLCNMVTPSGAGVDPGTLCSALSLPAAIGACALAVTRVQLFRTVFSNLLELVPVNSIPVLRNVLCSPPPASADAFAEVFELKMSSIARIAGADVSIPKILSTGAVGLGTYTVPGPCSSTKTMSISVTTSTASTTPTPV
jgi:hypothetical protein